MKQFKSWVVIMWRPVLGFMAVALVVGCILGFRLGDLSGGTSLSEKNYIASVSSPKQVLAEPEYIVHKLPVLALAKLNVKQVVAYRAVSAMLAALAVISCFFILREWYSVRIAILGTWLFLTSALVLHIGRLATPEATFLLFMPLLWTALWLYNTTLRKSAVLLLSIFTVICFYIPGLVWLLFIAAVWRRKSLFRELTAVPVWFRIVCLFIVIILLAPLGWAIFHTPREMLLVLGLPAQVPSISDLTQNLLSVPAQLFWQGPDDPVRWLGRLPILDVFSTVMFVLGIYSLRFYLKLVKVRLLLVCSVLLIILISLGGPVTITALIPIVYLVLSGGIAFLLRQWLVVFPRNPVARTLATTSMSLVVLVVSYYHISHYFIAWPGTPATKAAFSHSLVK